MHQMLQKSADIWGKMLLLVKLLKLSIFLEYQLQFDL